MIYTGPKFYRHHQHLWPWPLGHRLRILKMLAFYGVRISRNKMCNIRRAILSCDRSCYTYMVECQCRLWADKEGTDMLTCTDWSRPSLSAYVFSNAVICKFSKIEPLFPDHIAYIYCLSRVRIFSTFCSVLHLHILRFLPTFLWLFYF